MNKNTNTTVDTNNKENTMNNCQIITNNGAQCTKSVKFEVRCHTSNTTAYREGSLPARYNPADWMPLVQIGCCGQHQNMLKQGKAVQFTNNNTSKEDNTMEEELPFNDEPTFIDNNVLPEGCSISEYGPSNDHNEICPTCGLIIVDDPCFCGTAPEGFVVCSECKGQSQRYSDIECTTCDNSGYIVDEWYFDTKQFDLKHTQKEQLKLLEGQPFDIHVTRAGGKLMIERCDHEECHGSHYETVQETENEMCCGEDDCGHYFAVLCLEHEPAKITAIPGATPGRSQYVHETNTKGRFKEWHGTMGYANKMIARLKEEGFAGIARFKSSGRGFWVYWNVDPSLNISVPAEPSSQPARLTFSKEKKGTKCGNCGEHHANGAEVKACYQAAGKIK